MASALEKKRSRYNLGSRPFVIAVGNAHSLADGEGVINTLYGDPAIRILREDMAGKLVTEPIRRGNGFFSHRNTRVSGLLHALRIVPWAVGEVVPELWVNPFARSPLDQRFPWARTVEVANDGSLAVTEPTVAMRELFELSPDWPGPEQPFERRSSD